MKKSLKAAVIVGVGCMALGVALSGIGVMAGGLDHLGEVSPGMEHVSASAVSRTGIYSLPGIGNVLWGIDRLDDLDDILERKWEGKSDALEARVDEVEDRLEQMYGDDWEDRLEQAYGDDWEDRLERAYGDDWEDRLERAYGDDWEDRLEQVYGDDWEDRLEQTYSGLQSGAGTDHTDGAADGAGAEHASGAADGAAHHAENAAGTAGSSAGTAGGAGAQLSGGNGESGQNGQGIYTGDFETEIPYSGSLKRLDVELRIHSLRIGESQGNAVRLKGENADRIRCFVQNNTLYLQDAGSGAAFRAEDNRGLTLTVPAGIVWDKAELSAELASLEVPGLAATEADLETESGSILAGTVNAQKLDVDAELGTVEVTEFTAGTLDVSTSMGSVEMAGTVSGNAEVSADMGSVTLTLHQDASSFNYQIENEMGSVSIDGKSYPVSEKKTVVDNGARQRLEAEAEAGSVQIRYD